MLIKLPRESAIRRYWAEKFNYPGLVDDKGCFACTSVFRETLHRAHILARVEGGSDTVENLHMLCPWCHRDSEFLSGAEYWAWFESRTQFDAVISRLITTHGVQPMSLLGKSWDQLGDIFNSYAEESAKKREA